ncbi:MAG TPA: hypothetical protein VJY39_19955 [Acidisphaera sp.]|nr:hypothetical protein [Acidisphaera sp.]
MSVVQLPDDLKQVIDRQIAAGRTANEAEFLAAAIQRYAEALECDEADLIAAADEGIADIEAGRCETIAGPDDVQRLRAELRDRLDQLATQRGPAAR